MLKKNSFGAKYVNVSSKETLAAEAHLKDGQFLL
jgi:hypothetical protein